MASASCLSCPPPLSLSSCCESSRPSHPPFSGGKANEIEPAGAHLKWSIAPLLFSLVLKTLHLMAGLPPALASHPGLPCLEKLLGSLMATCQVFVDYRAYPRYWDSTVASFLSSQARRRPY